MENDFYFLLFVFFVFFSILAMHSQDKQQLMTIDDSSLTERWLINNDSVIKAIFDVASYTYGPLLGLYAFGFFTKRRITDKYAPYVCLAAPILTYLIQANSDVLLFGYKFGFELLILNGLLTFLGLLAISYTALPPEEA